MDKLYERLRIPAYENRMIGFIYSVRRAFNRIPELKATEPTFNIKPKYRLEEIDGEFVKVPGNSAQLVVNFLSDDPFTFVLGKVTIKNLYNDLGRNLNCHLIQVDSNSSEEDDASSYQAKFDFYDVVEAPYFFES